MCGIVAYSGIKPYNADKIKLLLTYNSLERGSDALGIYSPSSGVVKKAGDPIDLMSAMIPQNPIDNFFIGHVRAATVGDKSKDENAHPFERGNYIGVMNGTVKVLSHLLSKRNLDAKDYSVDSDAIIAMIAADNNYNCLKEIDGGCAILVVNKEEPSTLTLWRNSERPLFRGNLDGGMYISSIQESLEIIGCTNIKEISAENLYTIKEDSVIKNKIHKKEEVKVVLDPIRWKTIDTDFLEGKCNIELSDLFGRWIRCDAPGYDSSYDYRVDYSNRVKLDNWYLCTGYSKTSNSIIVKVNNIDREIVITAFDKKSAFHRHGSPVKIMVDLFCNKQQIASIGDIMYFYGYAETKHKYLLYKNGPNDKYVQGETPFAVDNDCFRSLTSSELYEHSVNKNNLKIEFPEDSKENTKTESKPTDVEEEEEDDSIFIDKDSLAFFYESFNQAIDDFQKSNNIQDNFNSNYCLVNVVDLKYMLKTLKDELDDFILLTELNT